MSRAPTRTKLSAATLRLAALAGVMAAFAASHLSATVPRPLVRFDGCLAVRRVDAQTSCLVKPQSDIVLWAENTPCEELLITESGAAVDVPSKVVNGGCQARVLIGQTNSASRLEVLSAKSGEVLLGLQIDRSRPTFLVRTSRTKLRAVPDLREAEDEYRNKLIASTSIEERIDITYALAVTYRRMGEADTARKTYASLFEIAHDAGYISVSIEAQLEQAQILSENQYTKQARGLMAFSASLSDPPDAFSKVMIGIQSGIATVMEENFSESNALFRQAYSIADGMSNRRLSEAALNQLIPGLMNTKQYNEAVSLLPKLDLLLVGANDCDRARILANQAWIALNLADIMEISRVPRMIADKRVSEVLADALASRKRCLANPALVRIYVSIARTALLDGRLGDAKDAIDKAKALPGFSTMVWQKLCMMDYEGQWALRAGKVQDAIRIFIELSAEAGKYPNNRQEFECRAALGKLEALGSNIEEDRSLVTKLQSCIDSGENGDPVLYHNIRQRRQKTSR